MRRVIDPHKILREKNEREYEKALKQIEKSILCVFGRDRESSSEIKAHPAALPRLFAGSPNTTDRSLSQAMLEQMETTEETCSSALRLR